MLPEYMEHVLTVRGAGDEDGGGSLVQVRGDPQRVPGVEAAVHPDHVGHVGTEPLVFFIGLVNCLLKLFGSKVCSKGIGTRLFIVFKRPRGAECLFLLVGCLKETKLCTALPIIGSPTGIILPPVLSSFF